MTSTRNFTFSIPYRFGYQGSEKDDEISGVTGAHFTTFFREGNTRTGRWWSIDPETNKTPWESPYCSMGNNPITNNDVKGNIAGGPDGDDDPNLGQVDENYIAKTMVLQTAVSVKNVLCFISDAFSSTVSSPVIFRKHDYVVVAGKDGDPFIKDLGPNVQIAPVAAFFAGLDAFGVLPFLPGNNGVAMVKNNTAPTLINSLKKLKDIAKGLGNNAIKMTSEEIGEFLNAGKDWHKTTAKQKFLSKFKKDLKGDTNADFWIDKNTKDVLLKSNKSGNWIKTGQKFD